jgi:lipoprotein-anchoring transpeptidase ErfK/SrfK
MPFSVHSGQGWIYLHVSSRVTGYSASHGCFRLAIVPARYFYNKLNKDTPIVFMGYKESF